MGHLLDSENGKWDGNLGQQRCVHTNRLCSRSSQWLLSAVRWLLTSKLQDSIIRYIRVKSCHKTKQGPGTNTDWLWRSDGRSVTKRRCVFMSLPVAQFLRRHSRPGLRAAVERVALAPVRETVHIYRNNANRSTSPKAVWPRLNTAVWGCWIVCPPKNVLLVAKRIIC
jgi:hypothetical protein